MRRKNFQEPDHHTSTGLPMIILLLFMLAISAYLLVEGSLVGGEHAGSKVYLPVPQTQGP
ncbi:hypothetical protein CN217_10845 [Sinorhizobium meliloti]|nr:hypothetical protein CN217_10845 [Sinorhizobium meliloti]RVH19686.1 hypothetical protein CN215_27925 [Sinorhizobium meliloti]